MSSRAFDSHKNGREEESASASEESLSEPAPQDESLLEEVLERTLAASDSLDSSDRSDLEPLLAVASRHRGRPFALEPVLVDLVQTVLQDQFPQSTMGAESWQQVSARLAKTLFDDPISQERLNALWTRLSAVQE